MEYMQLLGTADVLDAGRLMQAAAKDQHGAVEHMEWVLGRFLEQFTEQVDRLERVMTDDA